MRLVHDRHPRDVGRHRWADRGTEEARQREFFMNQRFVSLAFTAGTGSLSVQTPPNANLAPPGYYMLFIFDTNGVPSVAAIMRIG
ncbi:MAG: hypothetical protein DMD96_27685 [Candidatus Rokuibacteriota bacterium]|nr:MAG: hypothetical protein DMD96_27685 [Candidatus Rokubacteria bacterium]